MNAIIDNIETKIETDFEKACKFLNAIRHKLDDEAVALFHEIFNTPKVNLSAGESSLGKSTATSNVSGTGASTSQDSLSSSIFSTPTVLGATSSPESVGTIGEALPVESAISSSSSSFSVSEPSDPMPAIQSCLDHASFNGDGMQQASQTPSEAASSPELNAGAAFASATTASPTSSITSSGQSSDPKPVDTIDGIGGGE